MPHHLTNVFYRDPLGRVATKPLQTQTSIYYVDGKLKIVKDIDPIPTGKEVYRITRIEMEGLKLSNLTDEGKIPARTVCYFEKQCTLKQEGCCPHRGVDQLRDYFCPAAKGFDLIRQLYI